MPIKSLPILGGAAVLAVTTPSLLAAGFQLAERSASGLGRAFSGEAAIADDATVIASNPAGMILLDDLSISAGLSYINPGVDVSGFGALALPNADSDIIDEAVVPYFYAAKRINDRVSVGLGVSTPFGLVTDYSTSFASLSATDLSEVLTINVNPSVAYRVNKHFTIGAGFNGMYADGELTARDPSLGGAPLFSLKGDDIAYGWNLGLLYEVSEGTRFGLHYRSAIDLNLEGNATLGAGFGPAAGSYPTASLAVDLPDTLEFSAYHELLEDKWAVHADVLWTHWSRFEELAPVVTGDPLADGPLRVVENWNNSIRLSIGTTVYLNDRWTLRAGFAWDESPVEDATRTLRIPDGDRYWASAGVTYRINPCYTVDVGYTHIFADDVSLAPLGSGGNTTAFSGTAEGDVDLLAVGLNGSF